MQQQASGKDDDIVVLSPPSDFQMADEWYTYATPEHFWFQWRFRIIKHLMRKDELGARILEIGCGNGAARAQIEQGFDCQIDGCDLNLAALRTATRGRGGLFFYNIFQQRPEWQQYFDSVVLLDTLEHIQEPEPFLKAIGYHMKPRGFLLINVPALQSLYSQYDTVAGHARRYREPLLRKELEAAGFSIVRYSYWGLTMIPVVALRKLWLNCVSTQHTIRSGFQPGRLSDGILRGLSAFERTLLPLPPVGTSLMAVAQRNN